MGSRSRGMETFTASEPTEMDPSSQRRGSNERKWNVGTHLKHANANLPILPFKRWGRCCHPAATENQASSERPFTFTPFGSTPSDFWPYFSWTCGLIATFCFRGQFKDAHALFDWMFFLYSYVHGEQSFAHWKVSLFVSNKNDWLVFPKISFTSGYLTHWVFL